MHCVAFEKAVYENLAPAHQEGLLFLNQKTLPRCFFQWKSLVVWWRGRSGPLKLICDYMVDMCRLLAYLHCTDNNKMSFRLYDFFSWCMYGTPPNGHPYLCQMNSTCGSIS